VSGVDKHGVTGIATDAGVLFGWYQVTSPVQLAFALVSIDGGVNPLSLTVLGAQSPSLSWHDDRVVLAYEQVDDAGTHIEAEVRSWPALSPVTVFQTAGPADTEPKVARIDTEHALLSFASQPTDGGPARVSVSVLGTRLTGETCSDPSSCATGACQASNCLVSDGGTLDGGAPIGGALGAGRFAVACACGVTSDGSWRVLTGWTFVVVLLSRGRRRRWPPGQAALSSGAMSSALQPLSARGVEPDGLVRAKFAREQLSFLLQLAYSGELAATRAYLGHRDSLKDRKERVEVAKIVRDEVRHRHCILRMLKTLGVSPSPTRERKMELVGRSISLFCHVGGWFFPMYGAARLEAQNIKEYELGARLAHSAGLRHFVEPMLEMAEVEWDHELYFRTQAMSRWLWRVMPKWPLPPPRAEIRRSFGAFLEGEEWLVPLVRAPLLVR
jgi:hypothetical protein